jgi:hypothetical protein
MNDALHGTRDKRGDWKPFKLIQYPPVFVWPAQPVNFAKWFFGHPGFALPWNLFYAAVAVGLWLYLTPPIETLKTFSADWIAYLLLRTPTLDTVLRRIGFLDVEVNSEPVRFLTINSENA